jgi:hypothetical protein
MGAIYLTLGMPEVYRVLFEVFGMDIDGKTCQPQLRNIQDLDLLSPELDGRRLSWQEICFYQVSIPPSKKVSFSWFVQMVLELSRLAMSLQCQPTS